MVSFSTVSSGHNPLPTPSSCHNKNVAFRSSANQIGCVFNPIGSDIKPYQDCCKNTNVLTFEDGCAYYCETKGQSLGDLNSCLVKLSDNISCMGGNSNTNFNTGDGSHDRPIPPPSDPNKHDR